MLFFLERGLDGALRGASQLSGLQERSGGWIANRLREIESAHRYIIQVRLKISGAWWNIENAAKMLALRVARANGDWEKYWAEAA
jgi:hypothetical protein